MEGERSVCRLARSQIEGSQLILHEASKLKPQPWGLRPLSLCILISHLHSFASAFHSAFMRTNLKPSREGTSLAGKINCGKFAIKVNLPCTFVLLRVVRDQTFILFSWIFTLSTLSFPWYGSNRREVAVLCSPESPAQPAAARELSSYLKIQTLRRGCGGR